MVPEKGPLNAHVCVGVYFTRLSFCKVFDQFSEVNLSENITFDALCFDAVGWAAGRASGQ